VAVSGVGLPLDPSFAKIALTPLVVGPLWAQNRCGAQQHGSAAAWGLTIYFLRGLPRAGLVRVRGGPDVRNGER